MLPHTGKYRRKRPSEEVLPVRIALSFDDGPNNITTPQVLDLLEEHRIPASFFLIANNIVPETEGQIRRALSLGCDIENHSITHRPMAEMPAEEIKEEIRVCSEKIAAITGECPRFFRPPFISVSPALFDTVDLTFICGVGCEDWVPEVPAEERIRRILEAAADGVIYLLHDMAGNINTVEALKVVIPELKKRGFEFLTVPQLFEQCGVTPVRGRIYSNVFQTA
ncbi:MAG: polysaccharide deacetylase family protein [Clostridia bacterium]|nr:polysaccharide deacetylase family protein [Clostridia bacterium]